MIVGVRTPIRLAALRFMLTAVIARPVLLYFIKTVSAIIRTAQIRMIRRFCAVITRPPIEKFFCGKILSLRTTSEPQISRTISCTTYCIPRVAIRSDIEGRLYSGR